MALLPNNITTTTNINTLQIDSDEELIVRSKKKHYDKPSFITIGNGKSNKTKYTSIDLIGVLLSLDKSYERKLFKLVWQNWNFKTGESIVDLSTFPDNSKYSTAYKSLKSKDLIKRIRPQTYIINPMALIISNNETLFLNLVKTWQSLP